MPSPPFNSPYEVITPKMAWRPFEVEEITKACADAQRDISERISEIRQHGMKAMDTACVMVTALGYRPDECMIEVCHDDQIERRTLTVLGRPCFEVTVEVSPPPMARWYAAPDHTINVVTTPRVIEWPPAR